MDDLPTTSKRRASTSPPAFFLDYRVSETDCTFRSAVVGVWNPESLGYNALLRAVGGIHTQPLTRNVSRLCSHLEQVNRKL